MGCLWVRSVRCYHFTQHCNEGCTGRSALWPESRCTAQKCSLRSDPVSFDRAQHHARGVCQKLFSGIQFWSAKEIKLFAHNRAEQTLHISPVLISDGLTSIREAVRAGLGVAVPPAAGHLTIRPNTSLQYAVASRMKASQSVARWNAFAKGPSNSFPREPRPRERNPWSPGGAQRCCAAAKKPRSGLGLSNPGKAQRKAHPPMFWKISAQKPLGHFIAGITPQRLSKLDR